MDRRKAIAVAAAVTMSLTSGALAIGANFGAFGFGGAPGAVAAKQHAVVAAAPAAPSATAAAKTVTYTEHERGEGAANTRGEQNG